jgi:regulator of protease activity HflC (stomatin/prohibitin superfamily)
MKRRVGVGALALVLLSLGACTHPSTPEGHEGYIYHLPLWFGKAEYRETLRGPSSTGVSWRLYVVHIDMRAKSYKEDFKLLTRDNLSVEFEVNTRMSLRPGSAKEVVEEWGDKEWYAWNVREPLRTTVRLGVTQVSAVEIQLKTDEVRAKIEERLLAKYENTPIKIESVDIGNIRFPAKVTQAIEEKIGQQQELERQRFLLEKTKKEAAIRVLGALRAAKQQLIISSTLDPLYVQRMAVETYRSLAQSSNQTVVVLPNSVEATGMPLVLREGKRKALSPSDNRMLEQMETKYMGLARETGIDPTAGGGSAPLSDTDPAPGGTGAAGAEAGSEPAAGPSVGPDAPAPGKNLSPAETRPNQPSAPSGRARPRRANPVERPLNQPAETSTGR